MLSGSPTPRISTRLLAPALVVSLIALAGAGAANAETYMANSTEQLEAAVSKANATAGPNTIVLAAGEYVPVATLKFTNKTGVQTVEGPTALTPASAQKPAKIEGSAVLPYPSELFVVEQKASVVFKDVLVTTGGGLGVPTFEVFGELDLEDDTVSGNNGPGVHVAPGASATVRDSTISDGLNFGLISNGRVKLLNSTVAFNEGGGVENKGTEMSLTNSIVAKNTGAGDCVGKPTATDHSLDSDGSCGVTLSTVDPLLGPLLGDGGPTPVHSLKPGSPAIDAGNPATCLPADQRGQPRPDVAATACDIGADEYNSTPPKVKKPADITTPATDPEGAKVAFAVEVESDDDVARVSCTPESESTFPVGKTEVKCTATDGHEAAASTSFSVTVISGAFPAVETKPATEATTSSAQLNASVNPNGSEVTECKFEYGTTSAYGSTAQCSKAPGSGSSPVAVSASLSSLAPNTEYHFRISATNGAGTSKGADATFKTLAAAGPPSVETQPASEVTQTTAAVNATVNPNGSEVKECKFEYGTTGSYGATVPCSKAPGSGSSAVAVSGALGGLAANTEYHFRISATSAGGTSRGADATFRTQAEAKIEPKTETNTGTTTTPAPKAEVQHEGSNKPVAPQATIAAKSFIVGKGGTVTFKVQCAFGATACRGTVVLRTLTAVSAGSPRVRQATRKKTILTLASGSFTLAGGQSRTITLHLSPKARTLLARQHVMRARATLTAHGASGEQATTITVVTLRLAKNHK